MKSNSKYWDIDRTLTHNALFYVIVGNRSGGKSFGCKKRAIKNFITKGEQFMYVRRYEKDLKDSAPTFFDDIIKTNQFPDYEFKVDGDKFYCRLKVDPDAKVSWTKDDISLTVVASDNSVGLSAYAYSFDGGQTWQKENSKTFNGKEKTSRKRKSNKKDKNVVCFPVISSQKFGFSGICRQICRY